jgi:hypothetical protein
MLKVILAVVGTALLAFPAGMWAQATIGGGSNPSVVSAASTPSTISPSELQSKVKPDDLPVQYMKGDFN